MSATRSIVSIDRTVAPPESACQRAFLDLPCLQALSDSSGCDHLYSKLVLKSDIALERGNLSC